MDCLPNRLWGVILTNITLWIPSVSFISWTHPLSVVFGYSLEAIWSRIYVSQLFPNGRIYEMIANKRYPLWVCLFLFSSWYIMNSWLLSCVGECAQVEEKGWHDGCFDNKRCGVSKATWGLWTFSRTWVVERSVSCRWCLHVAEKSIRQRQGETGNIL